MAGVGQRRLRRGRWRIEVVLWSGERGERGWKTSLRIAEDDGGVCTRGWAGRWLCGDGRWLGLKGGALVDCRSCHWQL